MKRPRFNIYISDLDVTLTAMICTVEMYRNWFLGITVNVDEALLNLTNKSHVCFAEAFQVATFTDEDREGIDLLSCCVYLEERASTCLTDCKWLKAANKIKKKKKVAFWWDRLNLQTTGCHLVMRSVPWEQFFQSYPWSSCHVICDLMLWKPPSWFSNVVRFSYEKFSSFCTYRCEVTAIVWPFS